MQLSELFGPFNLHNLGIFLLSFVIFDAAGVNIACLIKPQKYLRFVYWLWGLALFVFFWFCLHFFLPFWPVYVWISLIIFGLLSLPLYLKHRGPLTLIQSIKNSPYPFLVIPLIFKPFYFLLNAPPYYTDEMAYHFYSPVQLMLETRWPFWPVTGPPSLYSMMPRTLDTGFVLMFSLTKTYATARLLNFLLVFSSFYAISVYFREKIGNLPALVLTFLFPLMTASTFLSASTLGYVDAGAAVLGILFLITITDFINKPDKFKLFVSAIVLGSAVSMKNTTVAFLGSISLVSVILFFIIYRCNLRKIFLNKKNLSIFFFSIILFLIFGGYWYLKNFLISGNPIYPMVFPCWHGWTCGTNKSFFQTWAGAMMDYEHFPIIKSVLFQKSNLLFLSTIISLIAGFLIGLITKNRIIKYFIFIIVWAIIIEILISKDYTGWELRYYYHWFILIPVLLIIPFSIYTKLKSIPKAIIFIYFIYFIAFGYSVGNAIGKNLLRIYEDDFVPANIRNFAMHRFGLNEYLDSAFPKLSEFIKWCGVTRPLQEIVFLDPALTWFSSEWVMRVYMVNCRLSLMDLYGDRSQKKYLVVSETPCMNGQPYPTKRKDPDIQEFHKLSQKYVCAGKPIGKYLYEYSQEDKKI